MNFYITLLCLIALLCAALRVPLFMCIYEFERVIKSKLIASKKVTTIVTLCLMEKILVCDRTRRVTCLVAELSRRLRLTNPRPFFQSLLPRLQSLHTYRGDYVRRL